MTYDTAELYCTVTALIACSCSHAVLFEVAPLLRWSSIAVTIGVVATKWLLTILYKSLSSTSAVGHKNPYNYVRRSSKLSLNIFSFLLDVILLSKSYILQKTTLKLDMSFQSYDQL